MNQIMISGRVFNIPKLRIIQIDGRRLTVCNFTVAVTNGIEENDDYKASNIDFFECICFDEAAMQINANFMKGSKITCSGSVKNHFFEDANKTRHFTNVLLLSYVEFGDTASAFYISTNKKKQTDKAIILSYDKIAALFDLMCEKGYLCIDEDEYYRLAMNNFF